MSILRGVMEKLISLLDAMYDKELPNCDRCSIAAQYEFLRDMEY